MIRPEFADPKLMSLADLVTHIETSGQASLRLKSELRSAVRSVARWANASPAEIVAHPEFIRRRLAEFEPAAHDISPKRASNVKSILLATIRRSGNGSDRPSYLAPLASAWLRL